MQKNSQKYPTHPTHPTTRRRHRPARRAPVATQTPVAEKLVTNHRSASRRRVVGWLSKVFSAAQQPLADALHTPGAGKLLELTRRPDAPVANFRRITQSVEATGRRVVFKSYFSPRHKMCSAEATGASGVMDNF